VWTHPKYQIKWHNILFSTLSASTLAPGRELPMRRCGRPGNAALITFSFIVPSCVLVTQDPHRCSYMFILRCFYFLGWRQPSSYLTWLRTRRENSRPVSMSYLTMWVGNYFIHFWNCSACKTALYECFRIFNLSKIHPIEMCMLNFSMF